MRRLSRVRRLEEVRLTLEMESCRFDDPDPTGAKGMTFTERVREATRCWRDTWVLSVLDEVMEEMKR